MSGPAFEEFVGLLFETIEIVRGQRAGGEFEPVTARVVEVDRTDESVIDRPQHLDIVVDEILASLFELVERRHLERQMLRPVGVRLLIDRRLVHQIEEGHPAPIGHLEEHVGVRRVLLGRRHPVVRDHVAELQAEHVAIELGGLLGITASIRNMIQTLNLHERPPRCRYLKATPGGVRVAHGLMNGAAGRGGNFGGRRHVAG